MSRHMVPIALLKAWRARRLRRRAEHPVRETTHFQGGLRNFRGQPVVRLEHWPDRPGRKPDTRAMPDNHEPQRSIVVAAT